MISFMISVVPPKIAMAGVGSVDSCVRRGFLPFTKKIWPGDQVAVQGSPRQIPSPGSESPLTGTTVSHSSTGPVITSR